MFVLVLVCMWEVMARLVGIEIVGVTLGGEGNAKSPYTWTTLGRIHSFTLTHNCVMWQKH